MSEPTFTLLIDGLPAKRGLTARECDALVKVARQFSSTTGTAQGGPRIDTRQEGLRARNTCAMLFSTMTDHYEGSTMKHFGSEELAAAWQPGENGEPDVAVVELVDVDRAGDGDFISAVNPASTSRDVYGPATVTYRRFKPSGSIEATVE